MTGILINFSELRKNRWGNVRKINMIMIQLIHRNWLLRGTGGVIMKCQEVRELFIGGQPKYIIKL